MRAIVKDRYGGAEVLELRDVERPVIADDEVLIRVRAAGLDPGVWHIMSGKPYLVRLATRSLRHQPLGLDVAGTIEAVGANVIDLAPGDAVYGTAKGSFADFARARAATLAPKPAGLSFAEAAATPISGCTALQGLVDQGRIAPGQRVLIIGAAGGVGTFAVQIAVASGAEVTGVCSAAKAELVRSLGAADVIDYATEALSDRPGRFDLILDSAGRRSLRQLRRVLAPRGTLVIVGGEGGGRLAGGFDRGFRGQLIAPLVRQRIRQLGAKVTRERLVDLTALIDAGRVRPVVGATFPLAEVPEAVRFWERGLTRGKTVISVAD